MGLDAPRSWDRSGMIAALREALVETLYPRRCAGCRRRGTWLCATCDAALPRFAPPWCPCCGVPVTGGAHCACAAGDPPGPSAVRAAAPFDGWLREAIISFKYHDERARAEHLCPLLAGVLRPMRPIDALVPVPLHPSRERRRGYNQSALLARGAGAILGVPVLDAARRVRATPQQARLGAAERRANVCDAFAAVPGLDLAGTSVVLIDDVATTGSTLAACAAALLAAGAAEVRAATLAREWHDHGPGASGRGLVGEDAGPP